MNQLLWQSTDKGSYHPGRYVKIALLYETKEPSMIKESRKQEDRATLQIAGDARSVKET